MTAKGGGGGERSVQLDVHILGRDYKVACKEHERADLLAAVEFLDGRMREIRDAGKNLGVDRIAVMAALNIANDLLRERKAPHLSAPAPAPAPVTADASVHVDAAAARRRIQSMQAAIDQALAGQEKLL
jgi:cell division protein ZapA